MIAVGKVVDSWCMCDVLSVGGVRRGRMGGAEGDARVNGEEDWIVDWRSRIRKA
jgi:hypothetical protein